MPARLPRPLVCAGLALALLAGCAGSDPDGPPPADTAAEPGERAGAYPDRVTLTWAEDPATSLSVSWRTDTSAGPPTAQIAPARAEPSFYTKARTVAATSHGLDIPGVPPDSVDAPFQYHSATFTGLQPDSTYAYRVGDGTHWSEWFHAETADADPAPFSFVYLGDAQNNLDSHWPRALRAAYAHAPDAAFMVHAGDLINHGDRNVEWARWHRAGDWIQSTVPTVPVPGNHEYYGGGEWDRLDQLLPDDNPHLSVHWRPQFALPDNGPEGLTETVYHLDHQGLRLIALNSMAAKLDPAMRRRQTEWLETTLRDTDARWVVVTMHHPIFSSSEGRNNEALRRAWRPLFEEHGVDLVLQGHDHTYARGASRNLAQGVNARPAGGPVYVNSVSGAKMYELKGDRWGGYDGVEQQRGAENTQLFQVVDVGPDTMAYRSYTVTGTRYDAFDLVRRPDAPNRLIDRVPDGARERTHDNTLPYERPER